MTVMRPESAPLNPHNLLNPHSFLNRYSLLNLSSRPPMFHLQKAN